MRQKPPDINFFHGKPSFIDKKMYTNSRFCELTTDEIQEIMDKAVPKTTKKPQSSGWGYLTVRRDFTHLWRLHNNNNVNLNVTEWLVSPGGATFSKPIEEMSKEELNVCLKCFYTSARKKHGTYYKSRSSMSNIHKKDTNRQETLTDRTVGKKSPFVKEALQFAPLVRMEISSADRCHL